MIFSLGTPVCGACGKTIGIPTITVEHDGKKEHYCNRLCMSKVYTITANEQEVLKEFYHSIGMMLE